MTNHPKARQAEIIIQESNNEILIYDLINNKAHCLNETSSIIWRDCDGSRSLGEIAERQQLPEEYVAVAVDELQKANLLAEKVNGIPQDRVSRRKMLTKAGATAVALPLVTSLIAPTAVRAQSSGVCLDLNETFEITQTPFFVDAEACVGALQAEAETRCCSGGINPQFGFEFGTDPQLCRGYCGGFA